MIREVPMVATISGSKVGIISEVALYLLGRVKNKIRAMETAKKVFITKIFLYLKKSFIKFIIHYPP